MKTDYTPPAVVRDESLSLVERSHELAREAHELARRAVVAGDAALAELARAMDERDAARAELAALRARIVAKIDALEAHAVETESLGDDEEPQDLARSARASAADYRGLLTGETHAHPSQGFQAPRAERELAALRAAVEGARPALERLLPAPDAPRFAVFDPQAEADGAALRTLLAATKGGAR